MGVTTANELGPYVLVLEDGEKTVERYVEGDRGVSYREERDPPDGYDGDYETVVHEVFVPWGKVKSIVTPLTGARDPRLYEGQRERQQRVEEEPEPRPGRPRRAARTPG